MKKLFIKNERFNIIEKMSNILKETDNSMEYLGDL
jgi:hypothetical protein